MPLLESIEEHILFKYGEQKGIKEGIEEAKKEDVVSLYAKKFIVLKKYQEISDVFGLFFGVCGECT